MDNVTDNKKHSMLPLFILPIIWGGYYVASQKLVGYTSVFTSGILIRALTMVLLTVIMLKKGELKQLLKVKGILFRLIVIGTFGFLLDLTAFIGLGLSSAGSGTALLKTDVLMVNILSMIIYKQKFGWKAWVGTLVMLFGVFLVMGVDFTNFAINDAGNIFFLLSAFFVSCNAFVIKSVQKDKFNPACDNVVAYYNNFVTMIYFTITSIVLGTLHELGLVAAGGATVLAWVCAGLGQTLIYEVYYHNLRFFPVWLVKVILLLMPIFSTFITFILFDERMVGTQYLGILVVILGALVILLEQRGHEHAASKE